MATPGPRPKSALERKLEQDVAAGMQRISTARRALGPTPAMDDGRTANRPQTARGPRTQARVEYQGAQSSASAYGVEYAQRSAPRPQSSRAQRIMRRHDQVVSQHQQRGGGAALTFTGGSSVPEELPPVLSNSSSVESMELLNAVDHLTPQDLASLAHAPPLPAQNHHHGDTPSRGALAASPAAGWSEHSDLPPAPYNPFTPASSAATPTMSVPAGAGASRSSNLSAATTRHGGVHTDAAASDSALQAEADATKEELAAVRVSLAEAADERDASDRRCMDLANRLKAAQNETGEARRVAHNATEQHLALEAEVKERTRQQLAVENTASFAAAAGVSGAVSAGGGGGGGDARASQGVITGGGGGGAATSSGVSPASSPQHPATALSEFRATACMASLPYAWAVTHREQLDTFFAADIANALNVSLLEGLPPVDVSVLLGAAADASGHASTTPDAAAQPRPAPESFIHIARLTAGGLVPAEQAEGESASAQEQQQQQQPQRPQQQQQRSCIIDFVVNHAATLHLTSPSTLSALRERLSPSGLQDIAFPCLSGAAASSTTSLSGGGGGGAPLSGSSSQTVRCVSSEHHALLAGSRDVTNRLEYELACAWSYVEFLLRGRYNGPSSTSGDGSGDGGTDGGSVVSAHGPIPVEWQDVSGLFRVSPLTLPSLQTHQGAAAAAAAAAAASSRASSRPSSRPTSVPNSPTEQQPAPRGSLFKKHTSGKQGAAAVSNESGEAADAEAAIQSHITELRGHISMLLDTGASPTGTWTGLAGMPSAFPADAEADAAAASVAASMSRSSSRASLNGNDHAAAAAAAAAAANGGLSASDGGDNHHHGSNGAADAAPPSRGPDPFSGLWSSEQETQIMDLESRFNISDNRTAGGPQPDGVQDRSLVLAAAAAEASDVGGALASQGSRDSIVRSAQERIKYLDTVQDALVISLTQAQREVIMSQIDRDEAVGAVLELESKLESIMELATGGDGLDVLALKGKLESCRQDNAVLRRKLWLADDEHRSYLTLLQQAQKDQAELETKLDTVQSRSVVLAQEVQRLNAVEDGGGSSGTNTYGSPNGSPGPVKRLDRSADVNSPFRGALAGK